MVDREKVIKAVQDGLDFFEDRAHGSRFEAWIQAQKDALALLKAQKPVKPVVDIDTWKCGNCGHSLEHQELLGDNVLFHEQYNFCPECGRPVKWE